MRKLIYLSLAATIMLQACSTGSMFSKKRYGNLKWINHNTTVETEGKGLEPVANTETKKTAGPANVIAPVNTPAETAVVTPAEQNISQQPVTAPVITPLTKKEVAKAAPVTEQNNIQPVMGNEAKTEKLATEMNKTTLRDASKPLMDETAKLIICVILALFIPPLAMYLWDQQTDVWFVVSLVLFLIVIFLFLGYTFGLAFLLSVIIAFLRIFGLI